METGSVVRAVAIAAAGFALGVTAQTGGALLLYTGEGLLATVGLLLALVLLAVAAGVWAGAAEDGAGAVRGRWIAAVITLAIAAAAGELWMTRSELHEIAIGRAAAVLVLLAAPAYVAGMLLAALAARTRRGTAAAMALAGAAVGVAVAGTLLIPQLNPGLAVGTAVVVLLVAGLWETRMDGRREANGMENDVVVITGVGERGQVGYALAEAFRAAGARLVVTDVSTEVEALAASLDDGEDVVGVTADLTRADEAGRVIETARDRFGRVDVLVNVAGGLSVIKPLAETGADEWARELDRNARTAFLASRAALPALREGGGAIVNFAAPAGIRAEARLGAYSAAKAAVAALTRSLALEEKENGVRVNAVAPGMIDTAQNRGAVDDPDAVDWVSLEEIARVVLFLAGGDASGVSGEVVHVLGEGLE